MGNDYLIEKKPLKAILIFVFPIVIGNLFQQLYTMADSMIVGRVVGEKALAAVGASSALTNVFVWVAIGGGTGASVIVSQHFGAREYKKMKAAIFTGMLAFLTISVAMAFFGLCFSRQIMIWLNTPSDVLEQASIYLRIYFLGLPFLFMYNILAAMFNALGKSRIPLYFLIFSSVFNVGLDLILVRVIDPGVAGAAWATLIAQGISCILSFIVFVGVIRRIGDPMETRFSRHELVSMTKIALPSILQQSTVSIGIMLVQSVVNEFGSESLAGYSAAARIESLAIVPMSSYHVAMASYTAQNIGAGKKDRVVEGYHVVNKIIAVTSVILCILLTFSAKWLIGSFLGEDGTETALKVGTDCIRFMAFFYCLIGFKMAADGVLKGAGDMFWFTVANVANLIFRVSAAFLLTDWAGIGMVWYCVPVGWFINFSISYARYRTGRWREMDCSR